MKARHALALFTIALLARLPFQTQTLWAHDSVLYERAMMHFSPIDQQPQPPGYLYYVLLLRAVDLVTGDANRAMTIVAAVAGAAAVALLYVLAARLYDERTGRISALLLLTSVTFWGESVVAYPYTLLAALTILCALLFWRARDGDVRALLVASCAYGVAIGFRFDLAVFLAPLWLFVALRGGLRSAVAGGAIVAALVALWAGLSIGLAGPSFLDALAAQDDFVLATYSVFGDRGIAALGTNAYELARYLGRALYFIAPLVAAAVLSDTERRLGMRDRTRLVFLGLWTLTPLLVYLPLHVGEYGYVFSMLPGLAIVGARGAIAVARTLRRPRLLAAVAGAVVVANAAIFLLTESPLSAADIAERDAATIDKAAALLGSELRDATVITAYDKVIIERYAPGVAVLSYTPAAAPVVREITAATIVVWDDAARTRGSGWEERRVDRHARLRVAFGTRNARLLLDGTTIMLMR